MKAFLKILGVGVALSMATPAVRSWAQDYSPDVVADPAPQADAVSGATADTPTGNIGSVSFQQFYDALSPYGNWINTDKYGYVFQPIETDPNWAPYTNGRWVNSDQGMTWDGNDPFSWATDHYGRWVNLDGHGWVWVPGYTWAPAWVSWRQSDGGDQTADNAQSDDNDYVGWAPLPPDSDLGIDYYNSDYPEDNGYHIGDDCDVVYGIGPWWYTFCPVVFIGDVDCRNHYFHHDRNFGLIGHTRNVTNINFTRHGAGGQFNHVRAEGPSVAALNKRAQTPIPHVSLTRASTLDTAGLRGSTFAAFAPRVNPATRASSQPAAVARNLGVTSVNHGTDINNRPMVSSGLAGHSATAAQIQEAQTARQGFGNARVATGNATFTRGYSGSLNQLRTAPSGSGSGAHAFTPSATPRVFNTPAYSQFRPAPSTVPGRAPVPVNRSFGTSLPNNFGAAPAVNVYRPPAAPSVYSPAPAIPQFRSGPSTPTYNTATTTVHTFAPPVHIPNVPSSGGGGAPHFSNGGSLAGGTHYSPGSFATSGAFNGGGHASGGSFSGGGGHAGGGAPSGGGGGGGRR